MGRTLDSLLGTIYSFARWNALAATLFLPFPAQAQYVALPDTCQSSRECFEQGRNLYEQGKYEEAGESFEQARSLEVDSLIRAVLLYNTGLIYEHGGDPDRAMTYFSLYTQEDVENLQREALSRGKQPPPDKEIVQEWMQGLKLYVKGKRFYQESKFLEAVELYNQALHSDISENARTALYRDIGQSYQQAGQFSLAAERYTSYLQAAGEGAPDYAEIEQKIKDLKLRSEKAAEKPLAPPAEPVESPSPGVWSRHKWSMLAGGAAVVFTGSGLAARYAANSQFDDLQDGCGQTRPGCSDSAIEELQRKYTLSDSLLISGGITAVIAAGIFTWESLRSSSHSLQESAGIRYSLQGMEISF